MGMFSGPKTPDPPPPPPPADPPPTEVSEEVVEARRSNRAQARLRQGRAGTILTSPQGLNSEQSQGKTLLGV